MSDRIPSDIFNCVFKETLDRRGIAGKSVAEWTGRSQNSISRIRSGADCPHLRDFVKILDTIEEHSPGFFDDYCRNLAGLSRRVTISPQEFVDSLDSSEFAALMIAAGTRLSQVEPLRLAG
jgi:predicted transcriptional regulator